MDRAVIIIGNHGTGRNFLPGVSQDMKNYKEFFLSNPGGAWDSHEIHDRSDWTKMSLKSRIDYLKRVGVEYFLIVFSGHGYSMPNGDIYLELRPDEDLALAELQRWLQFKKSLIITDSCRAVVQLIEKAHVEARMRLFSARSGIPRYKYRDLYDSYLAQLESGHNTVVTSTGHSECADDTDDGGVYSKALLDCANAIIQRDVAGVTTIGGIHDSVARQVRIASGNRQNPQIYSTFESATPPFVVIPTRYY